MRVLVLSPDLPFPPTGGGFLRTYHFLRMLAREHDLTLVTFNSDETSERPPFQIRVLEVPWATPPLYQRLWSEDVETSDAAYRALEFDHPEPWFVNVFDQAGMEPLLERLREEHFDVALVEHTAMARFLTCLPPDLPKILDLHNVHTVMARRKATVAPEGERADAEREARRTLRFERWAASQCAVCLTVSDLEADAARALLGAAEVRVVPNGVDTAYFQPAPPTGQAESLLFTGRLDYPPNVEAVHYFVTRILPDVLVHRPSAVFHIVGAQPGPDVLNLASEHVVIHPNVEDVRLYYAKARVVVVPLLSGGGTRLKILEAAASAKPIVSTSLGAEGLDFKDGRDLIIHDDPGAFAVQLDVLMGDAAFRASLGENARRATLRYDWEIVGRDLLDAVRRLGHGSASE
jgi:glycosyltransferase involved in cell wall biosynthesis